jgi:beta-glucanase (GH16 family)
MINPKYLLYLKLSIKIISVYAIMLGCAKDNNPANPEDDPVASAPEGYQLVWNDEFKTNGLPDATKWSYDVGGSGWGNNEAQYYTDSRLKNAEVKDGFLYINAIKEDFEGKKYTSARLVTKLKGDWLYGRIEVKAKLPQGKGMWPAIWMLPTDWSYGGWPVSGEIDIMEHLGYIPYFVAATAQTKSYNHQQATHKTAIANVPNLYSDFQKYSLEWTPVELKFYVGSRVYHSFKNEGAGFEVWPFDKRFHLILNVAIGGTYGGPQGIDDSVFPQSMVVDYVRVYQMK